MESPETPKANAERQISSAPNSVEVLKVPVSMDVVPQQPLQKPRGTSVWVQPLVFLVMGILWSIFAKMDAMAFFFSYLTALILVNAAMSWLGLQSVAAQLSGVQRWMLFGILAAAPMVRLASEIASRDPFKAVAGMKEFARDKLFLENLPCIFPGMVREDQPQRFFLYAPGSKNLAIQFSRNAAILPCTSLGHGIFMLDYDPQKMPLAVKSGEALQAVISADGVSHQRSLRYIHARPHPRWFSADPSAGIAITVSEETDELVIVRRDGAFQRIKVGDGPTDCVLFANGKSAVVCHKYEAALCIVDVENGMVTQRIEMPRFQNRLAASLDGKLLAVAMEGAQRGIQFFSLPDLSKLHFVPLPFAPDWIVFGRDEKELVITDRIGRKLFRLLARDSTVPSGSPWELSRDAIEIARPVVTLCRSAVGARIIFSTTAPELGHEPITANHYIEDTIHQLDLEKWKIVETLATQRGGLEQDNPGTAEHGVSPMGITTLGDGLLIAFAGTDEVATISPATGASLHFNYVDEKPLSAPHGVADLGAGFWCVSSPVDGTIGLFDVEVNLKHFIRLAPAEKELAKTHPEWVRELHGEKTFFEATRAGLSCQSCHLHTDTDHCQHSIGEDELVGVLTVHGVAGTSPYLREGPYAQLGGLHEVVLEVYRGFGTNTKWERSDALDAYMSSLPPKSNWRALEKLDDRLMREGVNAFAKAQCIQCHVPPAMTNLSQHPTNVVFPDYAALIDDKYGIRSSLDVPGLRSVSLSPPYLHDGRAPTLESIFQDHNPSNRHGDTNSLSSEEFRALLYFLEQL